MPVSELSTADREAIVGEVERLTQSSILHGSEALCRLLRYLADHFLAHPGSPVKEYQLAIDVFGRPSDFDPRIDSTVRVQTGRLRSKIADYYATTGDADPIVLEIPKGSYSLSFHYRPANPPALLSSLPLPTSRTTEPEGASLPVPVANQNGWIVAVAVLALIVGVLAALLVITFVRYRSLAESGKIVLSDAPAPFIEFWAPFIKTQDPPWVIFSNAEFTGHPQTGMRYFDAKRDSRSSILDHYTGVGEVLGVAELSHVFSQLHHDIRIKRGRLLTLDDVKNTNVVFLGSSAENLTLREITTTQEFIFQRLTSGERAGDTEIVNLHPQAGESKAFLASGTLPVVEDFAVIGLVPGMNPSCWVMVLAGTTTMGTQAAAEFVSREDSLRKLLKRTGPQNMTAKPFEAVIRVRISGGVPVESTLVAFRQVNAK